MHMTGIGLLATGLPPLVSAGETAKAADQLVRPNIVYILCDDLGYGDVQCLNPARGKIPTPHVDRLAGQGVFFTTAHSSAAVCTPTRYGILTGRYNWRSRLQSDVLYGYSDKPLIAADRLTVPALLRQHGYATACLGKWHLGMEIPPKGTPGSIRQGHWKLELCSGSGGWSSPKDGADGLPPLQLYDMTQDVGERGLIA